MGYLLAGLGLFIGVHLVLPGLPALRLMMIKRLGENGYKGIFTLIAVTGLVLIVMGYRHADISQLYAPPDWGRRLTGLLMIFSLILFAAANMPGNIKRVTRHPMLWGLFVWSVAHLLANGTTAAVALFGGLGVFALLAMLSANLRGAKKQVHRVPVSKDVITAVAGLVVYVAIRFFHPGGGFW